MIFFGKQKVVSGEHHDVDLHVESPGTKIIYKEHRKKYDSVEFNTTVSKKSWNIDANLKYLNLCICVRNEVRSEASRPIDLRRLGYLGR